MEQVRVRVRVRVQRGRHRTVPLMVPSSRAPTHDEGSVELWHMRPLPAMRGEHFWKTILNPSETRNLESNPRPGLGGGAEAPPDNKI